MMGQDDDRLMAFLDGELDEAGRAEVEAAIAADPALAARLEAQRRLRDRLRAHYGPVADEPVPDRLRSLIETNVVPFRPPHRAARPAWQLPAAIAASLVLGILGGRILPGGGPVALDDGRLEARGALAAALQTQLAADQAADADIRIGISFARADGSLCRTFDGAALSGLACRDGSGWQLVMTEEGRARPAGGYRQAGSGRILAAAQEMMSSEPLDAAGERAARDAGWQASR